MYLGQLLHGVFTAAASTRRFEKDSPSLSRLDAVRREFGDTLGKLMLRNPEGDCKGLFAPPEVSMVVSRAF